MAFLTGIGQATPAQARIGATEKLFSAWQCEAGKTISLAISRRLRRLIS